jgi:hypothetical protein
VSTFYSRMVVCPRCAGDLDVLLARGVHVPARDDLRAAILDRTFHRVHCAGCADRLELEQRVVYTDFERKHWIYGCVEADRADWPAWEARVRDDATRMLRDQSPLVAHLADGLRVRVVFGYEELREKLVVWEAGADDALIECLKIRAVAGDPRLALAPLVVERIEPTDEVVLLSGEVAIRCEPGWLRDTDRDRATLARRYPELFAGGYVNLRRLLRPLASDRT